MGAKDVSSLVDDPPAGNLKIRHDQFDLERSDEDSFQGTIRRCQSALTLKGVLSPMSSVFELNCRYDIEMNEANFGAPLTIGFKRVVSLYLASVFLYLLCRLQLLLILFTVRQGFA